MSLEGRDAIAHLKNGSSGASQLFPNTRVTNEPELVTSTPTSSLNSTGTSMMTAASSQVTTGTHQGTSSLISIEVDVDGNLVLHKSNLVNQNHMVTTSLANTINAANVTTLKTMDDTINMDTSAGTSILNVASPPSSHMSKVKKYHRRPREAGSLVEAVSTNTLTAPVTPNTVAVTAASPVGERNIKKELRHLHYCPVCNKGFKVNIFCKI